MSSSSSVRITVAVIVIFGFGLATVYASFEGDVCQIHRTETEGICRPLQKCPRTYAEIAKRQTPTFCRKGKSPIVCCPHEPKPKIQTPSVGIRNVSNRRISETKCMEYQTAVYKTDEESLRANDAVCNMETTKYVVNGEETKPYEFPHMASIGALLDNVYILWMCGGSLISEQYVLTAAHCVKHKLKPNKVGLGCHSVSAINNAGDRTQIFDIDESISHPDHRHRRGKYNDIGLIRLAQKVRLTYYIRPACLPPYAEDLAQHLQKAVATGWGRIAESETRSDKLMKVELELFPANKCNVTFVNYSGMPYGINGTTQLCVGSQTASRDTCKGDSGGPLQTKHPDPTVYCMYSLVGVTSFGRGCGGMGIYTQIQAFVPWIEDIVWPTTTR